MQLVDPNASWTANSTVVVKQLGADGITRTFDLLLGLDSGLFDAEVTCEGPFVKPPQSCFLDGVQLGTGATLGKRTIQAIEAKQLVVKVRSLRTKKAVEVRPSQKLMDLLTAPPTGPRLVPCHPVWSLRSQSSSTRTVNCHRPLFGWWTTQDERNIS